MENNREPYFDLHVFCCTNRRSEGHERGCCASRGAEKLRNYMKDRVKAVAGRKNIRINTAGCLDRCELGPMMVIYPDGTWYHYATKEDVDEIIQTHIIEGKVVKRLQR